MNSEPFGLPEEPTAGETKASAKTTPDAQGEKQRLFECSRWDGRGSQRGALALSRFVVTAELSRKSGRLSALTALSGLALRQASLASRARSGGRALSTRLWRCFWRTQISLCSRNSLSSAREALSSPALASLGRPGGFLELFASRSGLFFPFALRVGGNGRR